METKRGRRDRSARGRVRGAAEKENKQQGRVRSFRHGFHSRSLREQWIRAVRGRARGASASAVRAGGRPSDLLFGRAGLAEDIKDACARSETVGVSVGPATKS